MRPATCCRISPSSTCVVSPSLQITKHVAGLQHAMLDLQLGVVVHADRPRDDVAAGPACAPPRGSGCLSPRAPAPPCGRATIARWRRRAPGRPGCRRTRRRHSSCRMRAARRWSRRSMTSPPWPRAISLQPAVGAEDAVLEAGEEVGRRGRIADRLQRADDGRAGDVAAIVPAHAVGHRPDADIGLHEVAVLVALAHHPGMRRGAGLECQRRIHRPASTAHQLAAASKAPVSMAVKRCGSGIPWLIMASGRYPSPPVVHQ